LSFIVLLDPSSGLTTEVTESTERSKKREETEEKDYHRLHRFQDYTDSEKRGKGENSTLATVVHRALCFRFGSSFPSV